MVQTRNKQAAALEQLSEYSQWVGWEYREQGKRKVPINPHTWREASSTDASSWGSYDEAKDAGSKVGFVFSEADPFTGIDLDDCINLETGEVAPWAMEIVLALDSYTERSPSNSGLKIWIKGIKPGEKCRQVNIEVYDRNRFFTFTGRQLHGDSIQSRQDELDRLYRRVFPTTEQQQGINTFVVCGGFVGEDEQLLSQARNSSSKVRRLYDFGDVGVCHGDHSRADNLLCWHLAFWTGHDPERMDSLFRGSKLYRKKWDERRGNSTYGEQTIAHAIKTQPNAYDTNYKATVTEDIHRILADCMELAISGKWSGRSGPTERSVYMALINTGGEYGRKVEDGIEVCASERDVALRAGVGKKASWNSMQRLEQRRGLIRRVDSGGRGKAARYILLTQTEVINNRVNNYDSLSSQTILIRNPGRNYGTIGKKNAQILEYVHALGRVVTDEELAEHLGMRKNNMKTRNISLLLGLELLEPKEGGYTTPKDIESRLERELEGSGCKQAHDLQRQQYERERMAWREAPSTPTVLIPKDRMQRTGNRAHTQKLEVA